MPDVTIPPEFQAGPRAGGSLARKFVLSAGVVLVITGIAKILTGLGSSKFLAVVDPIIGIKEKS
jgi:hypothetical protein